MTKVRLHHFELSLNHPDGREDRVRHPQQLALLGLACESDETGSNFDVLGFLFVVVDGLVPHEGVGVALWEVPAEQFVGQRFVGAFIRLVGQHVGLIDGQFNLVVILLDLLHLLANLRSSYDLFPHWQFLLAGFQSLVEQLIQARYLGQHFDFTEECFVALLGAAFDPFPDPLAVVTRQVSYIGVVVLMGGVLARKLKAVSLFSASCRTILMPSNMRVLSLALSSCRINRRGFLRSPLGNRVDTKVMYSERWEYSRQ